MNRMNDALLQIQSQPIPHRPYTRIRGKRERSVTEITGLKSVGGLSWAAAKETAMFAVLHQDQWTDLSEDQAVERLRTHHQGVWDAKAAMGTAAHSVMESWFAGDTVDLFGLVSDMAQSDRKAKSWAGREDEATARLIPYIDGLEKWWTDWAPAGGTSEDCVRMPGVFIGQRDRWGVKMDGSTWGLDLKTSREVYMDSCALQLSAYSRAPEVVEYGWNDDGKLAELSTRPNEPVDRHGIVHLTGDGGYSLVEVPVTDESFGAFMSLAQFGHWLHSVKDIKAVPMVLGSAA